jgi:hypothetical protein
MDKEYKKAVTSAVINNYYLIKKIWTEMQRTFNTKIAEIGKVITQSR